jgi:drug/metabolite transporter (DMT)-like permease
MKRPVVLALAAVYLIWGSTFLAMRVAIASFPPLLMCGLRYTAAGLVLYATLRARGVRPPTRAEWAGSAVLGLLILVVGNAVVAIAERTVASSLAAMLFATIPLWTALFGGLFGAWPSRRQWSGLLLGAVGVALVCSGGDLRADGGGLALVLLAAAGMGLGAVAVRRLPTPPGAMASAAQLLTSGALLLGTAGVHGDRLPAHPTPAALLALGYLVVFGSFIGYGAYQYLLRTVRPELATSYAFVNPVVALLLGAVVLGEPIAPRAVAGMAVVLIGLTRLRQVRMPARPIFAPSGSATPAVGVASGPCG